MTDLDRIALRALVELMRTTALHPPERAVRDAGIAVIEKLVAASEREENRCPMCEFGDVEEDGPTYRRWTCGHWINKRLSL